MHKQLRKEVMRQVAQQKIMVAGALPVEIQVAVKVRVENALNAREHNRKEVIYVLSETTILCTNSIRRKLCGNLPDENRKY